MFYLFYLFYQFVILVCWRLLVWLLLMSVMADTSVQILVRTSESIVRCTVSVAVFRQTLRNCTLASPLGFVAVSLLFLSAPGLLSKTWLTGETALAVDLVRSPRQILVAGDCNGRLQDQCHLSFTPSHLHPFYPPVPLSRDESMLFLMPCSSPFLSSLPFSRVLSYVELPL